MRHLFQQLGVIDWFDSYTSSYPRAYTTQYRTLAVSSVRMMFQPLQWFLRLCGIAPLNNEDDHYFSLAALATTSCLAVHTFLKVEEWPDSMHESLLVGSVAIMYTGAIVHILYNLCSKQNYQELMHDLENADDELCQVDAIPHRQIRKQQIIMAILIIINAGHELADLHSGRPLYILAEDVVTGILLEAGLVQHLVLVDQIHAEFTALNGYLKRVASKVTETPVAVVSTQLETVFRVHSALHLLVADLNTHSFFYNLTKVATSMIFCVFFMYDYLTSISDVNAHLNHRRFIIFIMELAGFLAQTMMCHACAKEANKTVVMAHHILNKDTPFRLWQEIGFFSVLCVDNKVYFTVGGVFTLDRVLITKASVTALSYLIIAVQLKDVQLFGSAVSLAVNSSLLPELMDNSTDSTYTTEIDNDIPHNTDSSY